LQWVFLGAGPEIPVDANTELFLEAFDDFVTGEFVSSARKAEILVRRDPTTFAL
jgi:hypothetical protein